MPRNAIDYYLACVDEGSRCEWCRFPDEPLRCKGLCDHCYRISREIIKAEKNHRRYKSQETNFNLKTAEKKAELAKLEGQAFWPLKNKNVTGLDIEHLFDGLSKLIVRKRKIGKDKIEGPAASPSSSSPSADRSTIRASASTSAHARASPIPCGSSFHEPRLGEILSTTDNEGRDGMCSCGGSRRRRVEWLVASARNTRT